MTFKSECLDIFKDKNKGDNCFQFEFKGQFTTDVSEKATEFWCKQIESNSELKYHFIWDCSKMKGFEPAARREWYKGMNNHKGSIDKVTVIANNIIIRGAARVMLSHFGIASEIKK